MFGHAARNVKREVCFVEACESLEPLLELGRGGGRASPPLPRPALRLEILGRFWAARLEIARGRGNLGVDLGGLCLVTGTRRTGAGPAPGRGRGQGEDQG